MSNRNTYTNHGGVEPNFVSYDFRMLLVLKGGKLKCLISLLRTERQLLGYLVIGR
jgi:hypothetical protein